MVAKAISGRLAAMVIGSIVLYGPGLVRQTSVLSAGWPGFVQGQLANVDSIPVDRRPLKLTPHRVVLSSSKTFNLYLPADFEISVAAQGLKRVRFMARSPDDRVFVSDLFNRTDNRKGAVYVLDGFDT